MRLKARPLCLLYWQFYLQNRDIQVQASFHIHIRVTAGRVIYQSPFLFEAKLFRNITY